MKLSMIVAGAGMLAGCGVSETVESKAAQLREPLHREGGMLDLLRFASLAASGHNAQPWKFSFDDQSVEIHPDYSRRLKVVDPQDRELWISLGCALENLLIAASSAGFTGEVIYPEESRQTIQVMLQSSTPVHSPLLDAIPLRQSTRSEYQSMDLSQEQRHQIHSTNLEPGVDMQFLEGQGDFERVLEYINAGNLQQYADEAFVDELIEWIRFNKKEAFSTLDGLFSKCSGSPAVPRWLGSLFVSGTKPQSQADTDARKLKSSSGVVLIVSETDDPASWVRVGRVFERLSLTLTHLGIKSSLLNQPVEVPEIRGQFGDALGLGSAHPQLLLRYGFADALPYSLRRPVQDLIL